MDYNKQLIFNKSKQCMNLLLGINMVKIFARFFLVSIFFNLIPSLIWTKWYLTLICFVLPCFTWFLNKHIILRLSKKKWSCSLEQSLNHPLDLLTIYLFLLPLSTSYTPPPWLTTTISWRVVPTNQRLVNGESITIDGISNIQIYCKVQV